MAINTRHAPFRTWQLHCAQRHPLSPDLGRGPCLPLPLLVVKNRAGCWELTQQHHGGSGMGRGQLCPQQCQPPAVGSGTAGRPPAGWRRCQRGRARAGGRKSPKGPRRQRRRCQEGVKGSAGRCQGSVPAWCQRFRDARTQPAPSTPSQCPWLGGAGQEWDEESFFQHILPQISPSRPRDEGHPPLGTLRRRRRRSGFGVQPRLGKPFVSAAPPQDCTSLQSNYRIIIPRERPNPDQEMGLLGARSCTRAHPEPRKRWEHRQDAAERCWASEGAPGLNPTTLAPCLSFPTCAQVVP